MKNSALCKDIEVKNSIQPIESLIVHNRGRHTYPLRKHLIFIGTCDSISISTVVNIAREVSNHGAEKLNTN